MRAGVDQFIIAASQLIDIEVTGQAVNVHNNYKYLVHVMRIVLLVLSRSSLFRCPTNPLAIKFELICSPVVLFAIQSPIIISSTLTSFGIVRSFFLSSVQLSVTSLLKSAIACPCPGVMEGLVVLVTAAHTTSLNSAFAIGITI